MPPIPVTFKSLVFAGRSAFMDGRRRWIEVGMPQIPNQIENCSFFLFARTPNGINGPMATGFFVSMRTPIEGHQPISHSYAVTNQHTAPDGASIIRATLDSGRTSTIELEPHEWEFLAGGDDISAADVTEALHAENEGDQYSTLLIDLFLSEEFAQEANIGIGEDGFMIGLFADEPGRDVNHHVGRFGNVAAMPSSKTKIEQPNGFWHPSFLFDIRSRTGFSGSPVFVYRTIASDLTGLAGREGAPRPPKRYAAFLKLLGVHCGQYPELLDFKVVRKQSNKEAMERLEVEEGDKLKVASGMTIVAPAWKILKLLNLKKFKDMRDERVDRLTHSEAYLRRPVPEVVQAEPADANPAHKEDFTSLLNEAAQGQSKDD